MKKILWNIYLGIMIFTGIMFVINIVVFNNRTAAIDMHDDLYQNASLFMTNLKVIITFITGAALLISSFGIIFKKYKWAGASLFVTPLFLLLYIVEVILWSAVHPAVIIYFIIVGGMIVLFTITSYKYRKKSYANS